MEPLEVKEYDGLFGDDYITLAQEFDCVDGTRISVRFQFEKNANELSLFSIFAKPENEGRDKVVSNLVIPSTYDGYTVTSIGKRVFSVFPMSNIDGATCKISEVKAVNLVLPDTVVCVEKGGFAGATISKVTWSAKAKTIPDYCFCDCKSLAEVDGIGHITKIGKRAFTDTKIEKFIIPNTCKKVSDFCFAYCLNLKSVTWSRNCSRISDCCFYGCTNFKSINRISHITDIGEFAFSCTGLDEFNWPVGCETIPDACFFAAERLSNIEVAASVIKISKDAFAGTAIKKLDLSQCFFAYLEKDSVPENTEVILPFYA